MSDISLLTGVYANFEVYATLIDSVIAKLRTSGSNPDDPDQNKLAQLLIDSGDRGLQSKSYEALMLDSLLRSNTGEPLANLKLLGERLQNGEVDSNYQKQLERLAKELEEGRALVASRLRGRR